MKFKLKQRSDYELLTDKTKKVNLTVTGLIIVKKSGTNSLEICQSIRSSEDEIVVVDT